MRTTAPPAVPPADRPPHRPKHRVLALCVVVLLIAIPAGYLVQSAFVSRDSGENKQREAALSNLHYEWPSKVQRRVYEVPIPKGSSYVAYWESNAWEKSSLHVQFRTSQKNLARFLRDVGTDREALREGEVAISREQAERVGWDLRADGRTYAGVVHEQPEPAPDLRIAVDTTPDKRPRVYVVSTVGF
ncbi:hypothetical protein RM572_16510 [Streptomyces sp. DSM 42041]|uniref:Sugar kinase n=1 Tax=Streptomyces hazeniae TaxID=3075538 RepID=A0ABU2NXK3_9ACTN|nr:hypothetical protein [Streptomyces sp. DSM 42041]MDT0380358.1 hypothetical protein [Streptomyces sp. DSM 42041]